MLIIYVYTVYVLNIHAYIFMHVLVLYTVGNEFISFILLSKRHFKRTKNKKKKIEFLK